MTKEQYVESVLRAQARSLLFLNGEFGWTYDHVVELDGIIKTLNNVRSEICRRVGDVEAVEGTDYSVIESAVDDDGGVKVESQPVTPPRVPPSGVADDPLEAVQSLINLS